MRALSIAIAACLALSLALSLLACDDDLDSALLLPDFAPLVDLADAATGARE